MADTIKLPRAGRAKRAHAATLETPLVRACLDAINSLAYANVWRNSTGMLEDRFGTKVRFGLAVGSPDLVGLVRPGGRFVGLEVKTADGRVSDDQQRFLEIIRKGGGFACVVRSVQEACSAIDRARLGLSE